MGEYMPGAAQLPQPGGVPLDTSLPARWVWHITWDQLQPDGAQPDMHAVGDYLVSKEWCPHILWNPFTGEMIQYYPRSVGSRALMYNDGDGAADVQIEVFFSPNCVVDGIRYATVADTPLIGFEALLEWADSMGVPRVWPMGAPQWAGNSRDVDTWNNNAGHYGHCNSPGDTHTDPGPMPDLNNGGDNELDSTQATQLQEVHDRMMFVFSEPFDKGLTTKHIPQIADAVLDDKSLLPGGGTTSARTKIEYQKQEFDVLGNKVDTAAAAAATAAKAQADTLTKISGQLGQLITLLTPAQATAPSPTTTGTQTAPPATK